MAACEWFCWPCEPWLLPTHQNRAAGACFCLYAKLKPSAVTDACQQSLSEPTLIKRKKVFMVYVQPCAIFI